MRRTVANYTPNYTRLSLDGRRHNKQKGILEYVDTAHVSKPHVNPDYQAAIATRPTSFHRKAGLCSNFAEWSGKYHEPHPFKAGR